jgi:antitoxin HicB
MKLAYPIDILPQDDGSFLVSFPDIPEALTDGMTKDEALA